ADRRRAWGIHVQRFSGSNGDGEARAQDGLHGRDESLPQPVHRTREAWRPEHDLPLANRRVARARRSSHICVRTAIYSKTVLRVKAANTSNTSQQASNPA